MSLKQVKATQEDKAKYKGVYPLNAWLIDSKTGLKLALEDLRQHWSKEDPQWEVVAPKGYIFDMMETHSLLGGTKQDAIERASSYELIACDGSRFCSCGDNK